MASNSTSAGTAATGSGSTTSALDLAIDSIGLLRWPNKLISEDILAATRFVGWHESSPEEGERWLRGAAEQGDTYAMEALGVRLLNGDGLSSLHEEGFNWLEKAATRGSTSATIRLGEFLLDGGSAEGERWLQIAIATGNSSAAVCLATRLICGTGLRADPDRGQDLLLDAARQGSLLAHVKLAARKLSGLGLPQNHEDGLRWLRRVGIAEPSQMPLPCYYMYMKSLATPSRGTARALAEEAAVLFSESVRQGNVFDEVNLAYLLRRGEICADPYPPLERLLAPHVHANRTFALINQALRLAKGIDCTISWETADILIGKVPTATPALKWWFARSEEGDGEGHLVTGWLVRHSLALDPEQIPLSRRMHLARERGWQVPDWMNELKAHRAH